MRYILAILLCTCIPAFAQAPQTVQQVLAAQKAALQTIIDTADKTSATAALITQRTTLEAQLATLNAQIIAAEGPDVQSARETLGQLVQMEKRMPRPLRGASQ